MFGMSEEIVKAMVEERLRAASGSSTSSEWCRLECAKVVRHG